MRIDTIPPAGILLDKNWKFQIGDNAGYASRDYDDSQWQLINPTLDIHEIPVLWKHSVVWFRLQFKVDSRLLGQLAMMIQQAGASEIYLNRKLIKRLGTISKNSKEIIAINPLGKPIALPVDEISGQVLAVCYALQPGIRYATHWDQSNKDLEILINTFEGANFFHFQNAVYFDKSEII